LSIHYEDVDPKTWLFYHNPVALLLVAILVLVEARNKRLGAK
jgi:cytochrome c-type biogenesis protein CcmH/NrfF